MAIDVRQIQQFQKETFFSAKTSPNIRFYCALCSMQCNSQVGFAKHVKHPEHLHKELEAIAKARAGHYREYDVDPFSEKLMQAFVSNVKDRFPRDAYAHEVYWEVVPRDRMMRRLQESCWGTLGRLCNYLRDLGELKAWKTEHGWKVQLNQAEFFTDVISVSHSKSEVYNEEPDGAASVAAVTGPEKVQAPPRPKRTKWHDVCSSDSLASAKRNRSNNRMRESSARADAVAASTAGSRDVPATDATPSGKTGSFVAFSLGLSSSGVTAQAGPTHTNNVTSSLSSSRVAQQEKSSKEQLPQSSWVHPGLVVKVLEPPLGKAVVQRVCSGLAHVALLQPNQETRHEQEHVIPERHLQTVIPNIGRDVMLCRQPPVTATMVAVHEARFCVDLRMRDGSIIHGVSYGEVCKLHQGFTSTN